MYSEKLQIRYSKEADAIYAPKIHQMYKEEASRGDIGLAVRPVSYLNRVISEGKGVLAFYENELAGFCYIETWEHEQYLANSGLIVVPGMRGMGIARKIKKGAFELSRRLFPQAKLFGITTHSAVMRINAELGYIPVTYTKLTQDPSFWKGCESCRNFDILTRTGMNDCLCTAMIYNPENTHHHDKEKQLLKEKDRTGI